MAAEAPRNMILRAVESDRVIKLKLDSCPASFDELIKILKEKLELDCDFNLKYEDPDFDGRLTCLVDIEELPQKSFVHISLTQDSRSVASTDTFSDVSSPERLSRWPPGPFQIPKFPFDIELTQLMDLWPALHMPAEVYAEFQRITNQNRPNTFYAQLNHHTPHLMALFIQKASKTGKTANALADIVKAHDAQELHDVHTRRTTVLHALPVYLREETSGFLRTCVDDTNEPDLRDAAVVLLTTITDDAESPVTYDPVRICYPRG
uniref:Si:ch211-182e10.4 n=1 Tax=Nothobranchius furzeri TaxID=105023 RepID=A0A1A8A8F7_NOTFU